MLQKKTSDCLLSVLDYLQKSLGCRKYCWTCLGLFWINNVKQYQCNNLKKHSSTSKLSGTVYQSHPSSHAQDLHSAACCMTTHRIFMLQASWEILVSIMHGEKLYTWANKSTNTHKLRLLKVLFQMTQHTLLSWFILCKIGSKRVVSSLCSLVCRSALVCVRSCMSWRQGGGKDCSKVWIESVTHNCCFQCIPFFEG